MIFFETYNARAIEVNVSLDMTSFVNKSTRDIYAEYGEHFAGPLVYQKEAINPRQIASISVYFIVEGEETTYDIVAGESVPLPGDYGDTEIWIEEKVVDNDHRYFYVEGKSNILEGVYLLGAYYSDKDKAMSQKWIPANTEVKPDGTFRIAVEYETITENGIIQITGGRSSNTADTVNEAYGKHFKKLTGSFIEDRGSTNRILLNLNQAGMDIDLPKDSLITEADGEFRINMPDDILFDFNESILKTSSQETLNKVITLLEELNNSEDVQIHGHTDSEGAADYNLTLSEERAAAVKKYLGQNDKLNHLNIVTKGFGKSKPIASNKKEEDREKNRRVEIVFQEVK